MSEQINRDYVGFGNGLARFTHVPSGDTIIRQPYMTTVQWVEKKNEFFSKHPGLPVIDLEDNEQIGVSS